MKKIINYSGISALLLIAALVFMPVSCSKEAVKENPEAENSSQLIKISGEDANANTKTTLSGYVTSWVGTGSTPDQVGIYSPQARTTLGGSTAIANVEFHAASDGVSSNFTGTMYWGEANTPHDFYAYYPYSSITLPYSGASNAIPITLSDTQTQSAANSNSHIGALDFMIATPKTVTSPSSTAQIANNEVSLRYNHVFSILEFQIKGTGTLKAVKLVTFDYNNPISLGDGSTVDITQTTPTTGTSYIFSGEQMPKFQIVVTLATPAILSTTTATSVYMVVNPGAQTGNCTIELSSDGTNYLTISKPAPVADGGFKRGKKYVMSIEADQDGNFFSTVTIGTQTWMAENLKTTHYSDVGTTDIPNVTASGMSAGTWGGLSTGAYCWYNNDIANKAIYGALYNWYAVNTGNLCPTGWHVPTNDQWTTLITYLGGEEVAGGKLKEIGTNHWTTPNTGATNDYGFTALPGSFRNGAGGFSTLGQNTGWLSNEGRYYMINNNSTSLYGYDNAGNYGFSVRCVKGETTPYLSTTAASTIASNSAISGGEITSDGGSSVTARGVCWNTIENPTTSNTKTTDGTGIGSFTSLMSGLTKTTKYYVRAYATNGKGTTYGSQRDFTTGNTISDKDGNIYNTVTIGNQTWMAENLKTTKYRNDELIVPTATTYTDAEWAVLTAGAYCWYNNDEATYKATYGALYNWRAVNTGILCPTGWSVPTETEWTTLTDYLGGLSVAGGKLKETGTSHWLSPNTGATNSSGFTALPGGYRYSGAFLDIGIKGYLWSSTESGTYSARLRSVSNGGGNAINFDDSKSNGYSVRCLKD